MTNDKNLTLNGLTVPHALYVLLSVAMVGVSIYLTNHFFQAHFPQGFEDAGLCNINSFWSCDHASLSPAGKIMNVPTSFFGIIIGLMGIIGAIFPSMLMEKTNKFFITLNAIGCLILALYSLIVLGGLCPFCTVYYVLSWIALFLFYKYSNVKPVPDFRPSLVWGIIIIVSGFFFAKHYATKMAQKESLASQYVQKFQQLRVSGDPITDSDFRLASASEKFSDAPLRISIFSDFQCPFCKYAAQAVEEVIETYTGKINVQYFFYPLDNACNHNVQHAMHPFACKAATLAACDKEKFKEIHDAFFENQASLSNDFLDKLAKDNGLEGCFESDEAKKKVLDAIAMGDAFSVNSTPVMIINGRKITAALEAVNMKAILDSLLKEEGK